MRRIALLQLQLMDQLWLALQLSNVQILDWCKCAPHGWLEILFVGGQAVTI
jgi:hypothetical protein